MSPLTIENMAEFTPSASARVRTAIAVKPGVLMSCRKANRKSWIISNGMQPGMSLDSEMFCSCVRSGARELENYHGNSSSEPAHRDASAPSPLRRWDDQSPHGAHR